MSKTVSLLSAGKRFEAGRQWDAAERAYRNAVAAEPGHPKAVKALVRLLLEQNRARDALPLILAALPRANEDAELLTLYGRGLYSVAQLAPATEALERAYRHDPSSVSTRVWLARCRIAAHRASDAVAILTPLLATAERDWWVRATLGQAYMALTMAAEAVVHLRAAASLRPAAITHADLGWAMEMAGDLDGAIAEFDRALELDPLQGGAAAGKASVLAGRGEREAAYRVLEDAVHRGVVHVTLALTFARFSQRPEQRPRARTYLEHVLGHRAHTPVERGWLLVALGTLKESDGDFDGAFACFRAANEPLRTGFSLDSYKRSCESYARAFSSDALQRLPRSSRVDPLPVFIVGMPRSGTSLVEQILASHPMVHGAGELNDLTNLAETLPARVPGGASAGYPGCIEGLTQSLVDGIADEHLGRLRKLGGPAARVTDKMPQNFVFLGLIDLLFPGARVIHCVRHPMDTCLSCYTTPLGQSHGYRASFRDLAGVYRAYRGLMEHWRATVRVPLLDVRYESLVAEPERTARELVEFIGLPWDGACMKFHENRRIVRTASTDQVRRPIYSSSVGRWKAFEPHLADLAAELRGLY